MGARHNISGCSLYGCGEEGCVPSRHVGSRLKLHLDVGVRLFELRVNLLERRYGWRVNPGYNFRRLDILAYATSSEWCIRTW